MSHIKAIKRILDIFTTSDGEVRPHFIGGIKPKEVKKSTFQKTLD